MEKYPHDPEAVAKNFGKSLGGVVLAYHVSGIKYKTGSGTPTLKLNGGVVGRSCNLCHNGWKTNCTFCHGGTDNPSGAPPRDTHGATLTSAVTVGAHTSHLASTLSSPVACSECHVVPADALSLGHIDAATATLTFGTLATTRSSTPGMARRRSRGSS